MPVNSITPVDPNYISMGPLQVRSNLNLGFPWQQKNYVARTHADHDPNVTGGNYYGYGPYRVQAKPSPTMGNLGRGTRYTVGQGIASPSTRPPVGAGTFGNLGRGISHTASKPIAAIGNAATGVGNAVYGHGRQMYNTANNARIGIGNAATGVGNAVYGHGRQMYDTTNQVRTGIGNAATGVGNAVYGHGRQMYDTANNARNIVSAAGNSMLNTAGNAVTAPGRYVGQAAGNAGSAVYNQAANLPGNVMRGAQAIGNTTGNIVSAAGNSMLNTAGNAGSAVYNQAANLPGNVMRGAATTYDAVTAPGRYVGQGIRSALGGSQPAQRSAGNYAARPGEITTVHGPLPSPLDSTPQAVRSQTGPEDMQYWTQPSPHRAPNPAAPSAQVNRNLAAEDVYGVSHTQPLRNTPKPMYDPRTNVVPSSVPSSVASAPTNNQVSPYREQPASPSDRPTGPRRQPRPQRQSARQPIDQRSYAQRLADQYSAGPGGNDSLYDSNSRQTQIRRMAGVDNAPQRAPVNEDWQALLNRQANYGQNQFGVVTRGGRNAAGSETSYSRPSALTQRADLNDALRAQQQADRAVREARTRESFLASGGDPHRASVGSASQHMNYNDPEMVRRRDAHAQRRYQRRYG